MSNHTAAQIELLKKNVRQPLVINQVRVGLMHPYLITEGLDFNRQEGRRLSPMHTGTDGTLDYCRLHDIQIQAYSPVRGLSESPDALPTVKPTMDLLVAMGKQRNVSPYAIALAWLLRHPAGILPVLGASKLQHIVDNCAADRVTLSREEWYSLLITASGLPQINMLRG